MIEIRRILWPTDLSDISQYALEHAIVIARWFESGITALHVSTPMVVLAGAVPLPAGDLPPAESGRIALEQQVRSLLAPAEAAGLATDVTIGEGNPARCILERARTLPADMIVIGTHGQSGFERLVLGSVTERVVRGATAPVLTVPPRVAGTSKLPFSHLLCPVDFSDSSTAALRFAFSLAQESNARVTLLHVFEWPSDEASARRVLETSDFHQRWCLETTERLQRLIPADAPDWCSPQPTLAFGKAYREILGFAAREHVDLIVMGVRGRNPVDLMMFGSTTNQVVRQAACPVLTLRG